MSRRLKREDENYLLAMRALGAPTTTPRRPRRVAVLLEATYGKQIIRNGGGQTGVDEITHSFGVVAALNGARVALVDGGRSSLIAIARSRKAVTVANVLAGSMSAVPREGTGSDKGGESEDDGSDEASEHLGLSA